MTGFNRRFSPAVEVLCRCLANRQGPLIMRYTMNAGRIPQTHWIQCEAGGGRNIGEACHIYDLFTALTGSQVTATSALGVGGENGAWRRNENFSASISFTDGSIGNLVYTSLGDTSWSKESFEVFGDSTIYRLDDYRQLTSSRAAKPLWAGTQDKGHFAELQALAKALKSGGEWPIPWWQQVQATEMSFAVEEQLYAGFRREDGDGAGVGPAR